MPRPLHDIRDYINKSYGLTIQSRDRQTKTVDGKALYVIIAKRILSPVTSNLCRPINVQRSNITNLKNIGYHLYRYDRDFRNRYYNVLLHFSYLLDDDQRIELSERFLANKIRTN